MIRKKQKTADNVIDLTGPHGNAFYLLGTADRLATQMRLDKQTIMAEMQAGDYEHLVNVFDSYFGDFITLLR